MALTSSAPPPLLTIKFFFIKKNVPKKAFLEFRMNALASSIQIQSVEIQPGEKILISFPVDPSEPLVYLSVGDSWQDFPSLASLPLCERRKWLHVAALKEITNSNLFQCWLVATDPLPQPRLFQGITSLGNCPLVSLFTTTFRSKERIKRPYRSLLSQTYNNWEWVILDDSGDDDVTYQECIVPLSDPRIKKFRQEKRCGYIGTVKRRAAGLCSGKILIELDHDDDLTPQCLERIVMAFITDPQCGFVYSDATEVNEVSLTPHWYGWEYGYGYGTFWRQWIHFLGRWQNVARTPDTNWQTIQHLASLPNHPRAWLAECYHAVGGHRVGLGVADDYDLLIRTLLCTQSKRIPHLTYIQYRNEGGNNQTVIRNAQIQTMCKMLHNFYSFRIDQRILALGMYTLEKYTPKNRDLWTKIYEMGEADTDERLTWLNATHWDVNKTSHLVLFTSPATPAQKKILDSLIKSCVEKMWIDVEVVIVGRISDDLIHSYASQNPDGVIRWWPLHKETFTHDHMLKWAREIKSGGRENLIDLNESLHS